MKEEIKKLQEKVREEFELLNGTDSGTYLYFRYSNNPFGYREADLGDLDDLIEQSYKQGREDATRDIAKVLGRKGDVSGILKIVCDKGIIQ